MATIKDRIAGTINIIKNSGQGSKVNFLLVGTQKGGTTALDAYLRTHPQICMAERKELHFFDNEVIFKRKILRYSFYHSHFNPKPFHGAIGESTPAYMYWRTAPPRIWTYNPEMKLIVLLRNPIERAFSQWNMNWRKNIEPLSFQDAIRQERKRCREALPYQHRKFSYVD